MKIKNTRVRLKDIHDGAILYIAHPWYGIVKVMVIGKPRLESSIGSLFIKVRSISSNTSYETQRSLRDMGVTISVPYNGRRTFKKLKQAEAYVRWGLKDPRTVAQHQDHLIWRSMP
jgi:hypothetical protein